MSKLLDIKLKNLPTKSEVEGLKQELKSASGAISVQVKQLTDDNARLKEEVISLRSDREGDKRTINMLLEQQKKTRKNAIVEYLDYQKPVTQLNGDMQAAKRD